MAPTVVHRNLGRRKTRIRECPDGDTHRLRIAIFGVKHRGPANGTEPEDESGALIANARIFGCLTLDLVWRGVSGKRGEDAAGSALAREAMADTDASRLTSYLDS